MAGYMGYMEELSVTEAENLKKTITRLFRQTCMIQMRYDPVTYASGTRDLSKIIWRCWDANWNTTPRNIFSG